MLSGSECEMWTVGCALVLDWGIFGMKWSNLVVAFSYLEGSWGLEFGFRLVDAYGVLLKYLQTASSRLHWFHGGYFYAAWMAYSCLESLGLSNVAGFDSNTLAVLDSSA